VAGDSGSAGASGTGGALPPCGPFDATQLPNGKPVVELAPASSSPDAKPGSVAALKTAIAASQGGGLIVIGDGSYSGDVTVSASGASDNAPVVIRAQTRLGAVWTGGTWTITGSHVRVEGIHFKGGAKVVVAPPSTRTRLTRCRFSGLGNSSTTYVSYSSGIEEHRMDRCAVEDGGGHQIYVKQPSRTIQFDHNHFKSMAACGEDAASGTFMYLWDAHVDAVKPANLVVEHNFFDDICANGETICSKGSDSWIRYNTFANGNGSGRISLRHGGGHVVAGNFMFDATGMTISGARHRIYDNYMFNCRVAFDLHAGNVEPDHVPAGMYDSMPNDKELCDPQHRDKDDDGDGQVDEGCENPYEPVRDSVFANNTVITDGQGEVAFLLGSLRSSLTLQYDSSHNWFVNNLTFAAGGGQYLWTFDHQSDNEFANNVYFGADSDTVAGLIEQDPKLSPSGGLYRPSSASNALLGQGAVLDGNGYGGLVVCDDVDGQGRGATNDIGCDQLSSEPVTRSPLTAQDVGPDAP